MTISRIDKPLSGGGPRSSSLDMNQFIKLKFNHKYNWIPLFNIFMLINMIILMLFGTFIFSLTESFIYFFLINYLTKYYYDNKIS